jgi:hypothetical protein
MRLHEPLRIFIPYAQIVENRIAGDNSGEHPNVNDEPEVGFWEITLHGISDWEHCPSRVHTGPR